MKGSDKPNLYHYIGRLNDGEEITEIDLSKSNIGDDEIIALVQALENNKTLQILRLSNNQIGNKGAEALATLLVTNETLHILILDNNRIGDQGVVSLAHALLLEHVALYTLDLSHNEISNVGFKSIATALATNRALHALYLSSNWDIQIGADECVTLENALLKNTIIETLSLNKSYAWCNKLLLRNKIEKINTFNTLKATIESTKLSDGKRFPRDLVSIIMDYDNRTEEKIKAEESLKVERVYSQYFNTNGLPTGTVEDKARDSVPNLNKSVVEKDPVSNRFVLDVTKESSVRKEVTQKTQKPEARTSQSQPSLPLSTPQFLSPTELYINSRVRENREEYEAALQHDRDSIGIINQSNKRYVVISSSNSLSETDLIMNAQTKHLNQNNNYYIINHHGAHWDTSAIKNGRFSANINSAGTDLACGCYTILQIIASDPNIVDQEKVSRSSFLKKKLLNINNSLERASDKVKFVNELKPKDIRKLISHAILNSNDSQREARAENILQSGYQLSNDDIVAALDGLGINYIERSQLHNISHGFDESDMEARKNRIRRILRKQEGGTAKLREDLYNEELSELSSFLNKNGFDDLRIGRVLAKIEEECEEVKEEKKESKTTQDTPVAIHTPSVSSVILPSKPSPSSSPRQPQAGPKLKQQDQQNNVLPS